MRLMFDKAFGLIDSPEEEPEFVKTMRMFAENFPWQKHFPIVNSLSVIIPQSLADWIVPGYARFRKVSSNSGSAGHSYNGPANTRRFTAMWQVDR
jgi:hypothetical protein